MTTTWTSSAAATAALAAIVSPFIVGPVTPESVAAAVKAAAASEGAFFDRMMADKGRALTKALSGTYDEFRAEAGLAG